MNLIEQTYDFDILLTAFQAVKRNGGWKDSCGNTVGTPGPDGVTVRQYEQNLDSNLCCLQSRIRSDSYKPGKLRLSRFPKPDGGTRILGISNVDDRIAMKAAKLVLDPIVEPTFLPCSHGFRKGKGCHTALCSLQSAMDDGLTMVGIFDIYKCFDNLPHSLILARLAEHTHDQHFLDLIHSFMTQEISNGGRANPNIGTPQGSPISPILMNLIMHDLDKFITGIGIRMVRYADDIAVCCESRQDVYRARKLIRNWCQANGLALKSDVKGAPWAPINATQKEVFFLGHALRARAFPRPNPKKVEVIRQRIIERTRGLVGTDAIPKLVDVINETVTQWHTYYAVLCPECTFRELDKWIRGHIRRKAQPESGRRYSIPKSLTNVGLAQADLVTLSGNYPGWKHIKRIPKRQRMSGGIKWEDVLKVSGVDGSEKNSIHRYHKHHGGKIMVALTISTADAAKMLGVRPQTLRLWRFRGTGPRYYRYGNSMRSKVYYDIAEIQQWLTRRSFSNTTEETVKKQVS